MPSYNIIFFYAGCIFYAIGTALGIAYFSRSQPRFFDYARQWIAVGAVAGLFFLITRYRDQGYLPLVSLFEITFFWAWLLSIVVCLLLKAAMAKPIQAVALLIFDSVFIWDLFLDKQSHLLNPLLNSPWLGIHVPAVILSYSAFALSFAISVYLVIGKKFGRANGGLDALNAGLILFGVVFLGFGIVTGSIWAHTAWGTYWSWDPKETWALITFLIYGTAVVARRVFRMEPFWQAMTSIAGFLSMLITFFGVSLFMVSHHAYNVVK
ncbi:MAG: cytochrome c biogenesis protein CcsA [Candidatus Omnitrophica bacterium]|nr:cytochrome c biogenesis protein CcsA [Candidatus Omnitrophota bacterium]